VANGPSDPQDSSVGQGGAQLPREQPLVNEHLAEAAVRELEFAQREACAANARLKDAERARAQIVRRMQAARREVYDANLRAEEAESRAKFAEAAAALARLERDSARRERDSARRERDNVISERDTLLSSTVWRATWPIRTAAQHIPAPVRRRIAAALRIALRSVTFNLPHRLRKQ
jgi:hypothetical protein